MEVVVAKGMRVPATTTTFFMAADLAAINPRPEEVARGNSNGRGLALDIAGGAIYWLQSGGEPNGGLWRATLPDGTGGRNSFAVMEI